MLLHALADLDAAVDGFAELVEHDQHGAAAHERVRLQKARGQIAAARRALHDLRRAHPSYVTPKHLPGRLISLQSASSR